MVERSLTDCRKEIAEIKEEIVVIDSTIRNLQLKIDELRSKKQKYIARLNEVDQEGLCMRLGIPVETAINSRISSNYDPDPV